MAEFHNPFKRPKPQSEPVLEQTEALPLDAVIEKKSFLQRVLPVFACGAGLFSDGYINNVRRETPEFVTRMIWY
jgi:hypothetical protein